MAGPSPAPAAMSLSVEDGMLRMVIDRPESANALDIAMLDAMSAALREAPAAGVGLVLIEARGERFFSAGGDLADLTQRREAQHAALTGFVAALDACPLPLACIQRGRAMGAGAIPVLLADIAILSEAATLEFPEMDLGLYPAMMLEVLSGRLPRPVAARMLVGARRIAAADAFAAGLVSDLVADDGFERAAAQRLRHYRDRRVALGIARRLRREPGGDLVSRVAASGAFIAENLRDYRP